MTSMLKSTWPLFFGMLLIMMGNGLQGTLLGVRGSMEEISTAAMGYIISAYFIGFLGGSTLAPKLIANVGHVRAFAALGSLASAALLMFAVWVEPWFWFALRLVVGFCMAAIYVIAESWLNNIASNESRGKVLSVYMMIQTGGIMIGQQLLNVSDPGGYVLFILISALVSVSFAPILLSTTPAPIFDTAQSMRFRDLFRTSPLGMVGLLLIGGVFSTFGMFSVYAIKVGLSVVQISMLVTMIYLGGLVLQYPIGWLSDHMDRRQLIIASAFIGAASALMIVILGNSYPMLLTACFILGGMANPLYSLLVSYTNDYLEVDQMASASGSMLFVNGFGAMSGPVIVGYLMDWLGASGFFVFILVLMFTLGSYGLYRMTQRQSMSVEDQSPYVPLSTRGSQVINQVAAEYVADEVDEAAHDEAVAKLLETEAGIDGEGQSESIKQDTDQNLKQL